MLTSEKYQLFANNRDKLLNENTDLSQWNYYKNLYPITEQTLTYCATSLKIVGDFHAFIRQWWFQAKLEEFMNYQENKSTGFYWRKLYTLEET